MKINFLKTLLVTLPFLIVVCSSVLAEERTASNKKDNTAINERDNRDDPSTADQQTLTDSGVEVIAAVRRAILENDELSTYGENVKIVQENGNVVLRGPVPNMEEKNWIGQAAKKAAPKITVINKLEITVKD